MDRVGDVEPDAELYALLTDPGAVDRTVARAQGFAIRRLVVAIADGVQIFTVGLITASGPLAGHPGSTLGLAATIAALAVTLRRATRPTTTARRVTPGSVAWHAALATASACFLLLLVISLTLDAEAVSGFLPWIAVWGAIASMNSLALRLLPLPKVRRISRRAIQPTAVVVGTPDCARTMTDILSGYGTHQVLAEVDPDDPDAMRELERLARRGAVDRVVIVGVSGRSIDRICLALSDAPVAISFGLTPPSDSTFLAGLTHAAKNPLLLPLLPNPIDDWQCAFKRVFDLTLIMIAIPAVLPIFILAALAIRLESPGPIIFKQWRFGLGSRPTLVLKFRTMYHDQSDQSGTLRTLRRDPRVTRVGRWLRRTSIDELPQLLNVLRGDMSIVGPRPHATHMRVGDRYYFEAVRGYRIRHRVKPGITGWAQVTGSRGEVDTIEKAIERLDKDLWYIRNWSLLLDARIVLRTAFGGFVSRGAD